MTEPDRNDPIDSQDTSPDATPAQPETAGADWGWCSDPEAAEEWDAIVEDAMRARRLSAWRPCPEDFAALEAMAEKTGRSLPSLLDEALRLFLSQRKQGDDQHSEGST